MVGEEIEALEAHALNPIRFLVVPRVIATTISLVLLTVIGDVVAVIAGAVMTVGFLDVPLAIYRTNTIDQLQASDFLTGLAKAAVFGAILAAIACYNGLRVSGGAAGVGRATTEAFVTSFICIIVLNFFLAKLANDLYKLLYGFEPRNLMG